jgi:ketosteroid isomerase-like protein
VHVLAPQDVVRELFEAAAFRDVKRMRTLMAPDITAVTVADGDVLIGAEAAAGRLALLLNGDRRRAEVFAYRFVGGGDQVIVHGRIRIFEGGALRDSPASWRLTVRDGLVVRLEPYAAVEAAVAPA